MLPGSRSALRRYGVAVAIGALALILQFLLSPRLGNYPNLLCGAAIGLSAWYGGLRAGLLTTVFAGLGNYLDSSQQTLPSSLSHAVEPGIALLFFLLEGWAISWFVQSRTPNSLRSSSQPAADWQNHQQEHPSGQRTQPLGDRNWQLHQATIAQQNAALALRHSETHYQAVVEQLSEGIWLYEPESKQILASNPAMQAMLGYSSEELQQLTIYDVVAHDREDIDDQNQHVLHNHKNFLGDRQYRRKDGSVIDVEVSVSLIDLGTRPLLCGTVRDIGDRKQAELALRESEARFRQLAEHIQDVFYLYDFVSGSLIYISPAYETVWGRRCADLYANPMSFLEVIHPSDRAKALNTLRQQSTGQAVAGEYRILGADGSIRWIFDRHFPVRNATGQVYRLWGIAEDITDRKRIEADLQQANETLAQRIVDRTAELQRNEALFQASVENMLDCFGIYCAIRDDAGRIEDFRIEYVNLAACVSNRMSRDDQIGQRLCEILPNHRSKGLFEEYCQVVDTQKPLIKEALIYEDDYGQQRLQRAFDIRIAPFSDGFIATWRDVTVRKQAEEETYRRQQEFAALVENSPDVIARLDRNLRHSYINPAIARVSGISPQAFIGKTHTEIGFPTAVSEHWQTGLQQAFVTGQAQSLTFNLPDAAGVDRAYQTRLVPEFNQTGTVVSVLAVTRDITELKQAEAALQEGENRFRRLIESNVVGVMSWVSDGQIIDANDAFLRSVGYTRADLNAGQLNWRSMTPPDQLADSDRSISQMQQVGYADALEKEYIRKDGSRVPVLLGGVMFEGASDRGVSFVVDLTVLKRTEAALAESEARFRMLAENIPGMLYQYHQSPDISQDQFTYLTAGCQELYGLPTQAALDNVSLIWNAIHPADAASFRESFSLQATAGEQWRYEWRIFTPQGQMKWVQGMAKATHLPDHSVLWDGFVLDVTERKQAEADRDQLLIREQDARQRAEAASRAKDEFLAIVSHELRSPLNAILGWSRLLRTRQLDSETASRALEVIERNAQAQTQLIEDLLDISRIIRGKVRLYVRPMSLVPALEAALDTIRPAVDAKALRLQLQLDAEVGQVSGDSDRLQQIIWNLLSNAVKFTPEGGQITVRLEQQWAETQSSFAQITITDTGKGIEPEFLPQVFDRFRQAESSTTRSYGGLGLGLAIVRSLVELHGGTIHANSDGLGRGATFVVRLPLLREENSESDALSQPAISPANDEIVLAGVSVLIVDDEADTRDFLLTTLTYAGATVTAAASAAEAFQQYTTLHPNVVISDIGMPNEDGYSLIRRIRALPANQGGQIPAVAITAYAREEDRIQALTAGFQIHVPKPIDPMRLVSVVVALVSSKTED